MRNAIFVGLGLALALGMVWPEPAGAATKAECDAYLCLPAGFSTHGGSPANACDPAKQAVERRLRQFLDPLPEWAECVRDLGYLQADLGWTAAESSTCQADAEQLADGRCCTQDGDIIAADRRVSVSIVIGGVTTGVPFAFDRPDDFRVQDTCYVPPPPITHCPIGTVLDPDGVCRPIEEDPDNPWTPPVGPPVPGCNTISCPHVQHTWGANPLEIHWTLGTAPPVTKQEGSAPN